MKSHIAQEHEGHAHKGDELLTVREVARALRVDGTTCRRWIKNGALEAVTLPHAGKRCAYRVRSSTLAKLLEPAAVAV